MAEAIKNIKEKLANIFKNKHIAIPLVIVLMCVVMLIFISSIKPKSTNNNSGSSNAQVAATDSSWAYYSSQVASDLKNAINSVKGVSNAKVIVVVESTPTIVYLTEKDSAGNAVIVYDKQGSTYKPVATCTLMPKITGVLVVAKGVSDLSIKFNILNAIAAVYNVNVNSIEILEGK